jgi:hypothetical protein
MYRIITYIAPDKSQENEWQTQSRQEDVTKECEVVNGSNGSLLAENDLFVCKMITHIRQEEARRQGHSYIDTLTM